MALISTLVDNFDDNTVNAGLWVNNFGTVSETGGRARVTCDTNYNAYSSGLIYTLDESSILVRVYPPAAGGATTEAWAQVLVLSGTAGTDLMFEVDARLGNLNMSNRVGFADATSTSIAYSSTNHAWLKFRETGGQTMWETSADGYSWTVRKTITSPAYVTSTTLEFQLISHRNNGVNDFSEFDNVNVPQPAPPAGLKIYSTAVRRASTW